jgi:hypothetical protein
MKSSIKKQLEADLDFPQNESFMHQQEQYQESHGGKLYSFSPIQFKIFFGFVEKIRKEQKDFSKHHRANFQFQKNYSFTFVE